MARHVSRLLVLGLTLGCALAVAAPAGSVGQAPERKLNPMNTLESQVLADVNALRAKRGLRPLRFSSRLAAAAGQHSSEMAKRGYFSHDSANGSQFWRRVQRYYRSSGYRSWSVGENLLWSSPGVDRAVALQMWLDSPAHRDNLLSKRWREVGLSAVHAASAPGYFRGMEVTIVTANFGVRTR